MANIFGTLEFGRPGIPGRVFVFNTTAGLCWPQLFASEDDARRGLELPEEPEPVASPTIEVAKLTFPPAAGIGRNFIYGLATLDRLLPLGETPHEPAVYSGILPLQGINHAAQEIHGGWAGTYDSPVCVDTHLSTDDLRHPLEDYFGKPLDLCPRCAARLLGKIPMGGHAGPHRLGCR